MRPWLEADEQHWVFQAVVPHSTAVHTQRGTGGTLVLLFYEVKTLNTPAVSLNAGRMPRSCSCQRAWSGQGLREFPVAERGCRSVLRSQFGAGDRCLHCWLCLCMAVGLCMPVGVCMALLLNRHLAMLVAVLAAGRNILLHNAP